MFSVTFLRRQTYWFACMCFWLCYIYINLLELNEGSNSDWSDLITQTTKEVQGWYAEKGRGFIRRTVRWSDRLAVWCAVYLWEIFSIHGFKKIFLALKRKLPFFLNNRTKRFYQVHWHWKAFLLLRFFWHFKMIFNKQPKQHSCI